MRLAAAVFAALVGSSGASLAEDAGWETWPYGRLFDPTPRPEMGAGELRVCSFSQPVCVHAEKGARGPWVMSALATAEEAIRAFEARALLPPPMGDLEGGSDALDLYLVDTEGAPFRLHEDFTMSSPVDRGAAFALIDASLSDGCTRRIAIHRAVASAMLLAIDGGAAGGEVASTSQYLAATTTGCTTSLLEAIDDAQREPEAVSLRAGDLDDEHASPLLPMYLEEGYGAGTQGTLLTALFYAARQQTDASATRFHNTQSDLMSDVRRLAKEVDKKVDDVLLDYAITRAFLGDRDDGRHFPALDFAGGFARPRFDAVWPWSTLPRRVAFTPLEPTGATYTWLDLTGAPKGYRVTFRAEWESPVTMRWALIRVGRDGAELSRVEVTYEKGVRNAQRTVLELDDAVGLLVVGTSAGEVGPDHAYRVDEVPVEPHGGTVYLVRDE